MIQRLGLFMVQLLATLTLAGLVLAGLAVWRVAEGPVTVDFLTPHLAAALADAVGDAVGGPDRPQVEVGESVLAWGGPNYPLELHLRDVKLVSAAEHRLVAHIPALAVGLSFHALAEGRLALARIAVIGPMLHLVRTSDGRLVLDLDGPAALPHPELTLTAQANQPADAPLAGFLAALRQPSGKAGPLGVLSEVSVLSAALTVEDRVTGVMWKVPAATLTAKRGPGGLEAQALVELPTAGHPGLLEVTASERASDGAFLAAFSLTDVDAGALTSAVPALAAYTGSRLPLTGSVDTVWDREFRPLRVEVALAGAGPGVLIAPNLRPEPVAIATVSLAALVEPPAARFILDDATLVLTAPEFTLAASGRGEGRRGALQIGVNADGHTNKVTAVLTPGPAGSELALTTAGLDLSSFGALSEALAPLKAVGFPISGTLRLALGETWAPGHLAADLELGPGKITLPPDQLAEPVPLTGGVIHASADLATEHPFSSIPTRMELQTAALNFSGPLLTLHGEMARRGEVLTLKGGVRAQALPANSLGKLWPTVVGGGPRHWIVTRVSVGTIDDAWISLEGTAPLADPLNITPAAVDGGLVGSNLTVAYFKTLPPITGVSGRGTSNGRDLTLVTSGGHVLDMPLGEARLVFSKLDTPQEWLDIDAPISGSIRSALKVLDTAPLGYAAKVGIKPNKTQGTQTARLHFFFPLRRDIEIEDVSIGTSAVLHGAAAENVAGGLRVSNGELKLELENSGMDITGTAKLEGIPVAVQWRENFLDEADPQTKVALKGDIPAEAAIQRMPILKDRLSGPVAANIQLLVDKHKKSTLTGKLDLARARFVLAELNWLKPVGTPGGVRFTLGLDKTTPLRPFRVSLDAPGLKTAGTGVFDAAADELSRLSLPEVKGGVNNFKLDLKTRPDHSYEVLLTGAGIDARPALSVTGDEAEKARQRAARTTPRDWAKTPGPRYDATFQLARAVTGDQGQALTGLKGRLRTTGAGWDIIELNAGIGGTPSSLSVRYVPDESGRKLLVTSDDAGAVLRVLGFTDTVSGGALLLTGTGEPGIPVRPITAKVEVGEFRMVGAPLLARLLNALSVTGLLELLGGEGLVFSQLVGDLTWSERALEVANVRTSGGALGLTVDGAFDLTNETVALEGTIVPVYGINRILGMVPILGDLLSGGKGQGIFSATYHFTGPSAQPEVSVNPLAVLAPGFLRNLFFLN